MNIPDFKGKTILVAEDEDINYMFLEESLKLTNALVLWAKDGIEAITIVKNQNVDLVLMDMKMPNKNGYEATIEIKKLYNIPIIAQTAYAMSDEKERITQAGCDEYITKPIRQQVLFSTLQKYLILNG